MKGHFKDQVKLMLDCLTQIFPFSSLKNKTAVLIMVLMERIELSTSPLPRVCSTTEPHQQSLCAHVLKRSNTSTNYLTVIQEWGFSTRLIVRNWQNFTRMTNGSSTSSLRLS